MNLLNEYSYIGYDLVIDEIPYQSRVLDLGCGDGTLLVMLQKEKGVKGFGVEISEEGVSMCVEKGLYCYQGDIDEGLSDYKTNSFSYVVLNQTLQNTKRPDYVLKEILRISEHAIISFPNYGYILNRLHLLFRGTIPKNPQVPFEWYESPDIHQLTIRDFKHFCVVNGYEITKESHFSVYVNNRSRIIKMMPNLFAQYGFFILKCDDC